MAIGIGNRTVRAAQVAYAERVGNDQDKIHAAIEAALLHLAGEGLLQTTDAVRQCRVCGCTDEEACPGGCSWSQPEICSTCAARQQAADGPTDYEVWRDACTLAATQPYVSGVEVCRITLLANAEWWWENLQEVPVQKRDLVQDESLSDDEGPLSKPDPAHYRDDAEGHAAYARAARLYREQEEAATDLILNCPTCGAGQPHLHAKDCPRYDAARTFPGVNPDGTGTGEFSGRAGG